MATKTLGKSHPILMNFGMHQGTKEFYTKLSMTFICKGEQQAHEFFNACKKLAKEEFSEK